MWGHFKYYLLTENHPSSNFFRFSTLFQNDIVFVASVQQAIQHLEKAQQTRNSEKIWSDIGGLLLLFISGVIQQLYQFLDIFR